MAQREYSGILEKQKETMRTWAQRFCWVKDGKLFWAEPSKKAKDPLERKEKGWLWLADILLVERKPSDERRRQFVVKTEDRSINFAAATDEEYETWIDVLTPVCKPVEYESRRRSDEEDESGGQILRRFTARLVRSEEVVVTVRSNLAVEVSKYVGGGFRLRLDELQPSTKDSIEVDAEHALALGLPVNVPLCVVARGGEPWSATDTDRGACFLAFLDAEARRSWLDVRRAVDERASNVAAAHSRLAGWKVAPQWWQLFGALQHNGDGDYACTLLRSLESWLRDERPDLLVREATDDRVRFPTRYAPPPSALRDRPLLATVALPPTYLNKIAISCQGWMTVDTLLKEISNKLVSRSSRQLVHDSLLSAIAAPERCALRIAGIRSYLCRRDAPLLASVDFVSALRNSVKPIPTVGLVLEVGLNDDEARAVASAHDRLAKYGKLLLLAGTLHFPTNEIAAALRERPPNVAKLASMPDGQLEPYLPQLVQALKSETLSTPRKPLPRTAGIATPLVRFLLARALLNPVFVGASLFWALRSEMSNGGCSARVHGVMLAIYVAAVGTKCRIDLEKQVVLDSQLRLVSKAASSIDDKLNRSQYAQRELRRLARSGELPAGMDLPSLPGRRAGAVQPDACRVLSSKAAPILIAFDDAEFGVGVETPGTADRAKLLVIFKTGDDLRQDAAMLQAMRQMDALWLQAGHECWLRTYNVAATDVDVGWIEVVRSAKETAEIQSAKGTFGAFQNDTLKCYLEEHNEEPKAYAAAQCRFAASCAACCVATYVLGIADRHNGNIMLSSDGRLFHIDFGHVLGHFKKLKGTSIKREKTKLVLTPEMMYVINEGNGVAMNATFEQRCCDLISVLRETGNLALLFQLLKELVPAKMPEINEDSIFWVAEVLNKPEAELKAELKGELSSALSDWLRRLDNANHNRIHQGTPANAKARVIAQSLSNPQQRFSTITEAQHEVEELRRLLTAAEAKNVELSKQLLAALEVAR